MKSTYKFSFLMLMLIATLPVHAAEPKPSCSDGKLRLCVHKSSLPFDPVGK